MALPTASDNAFPSLLITEGSAPTAPASGKDRLYIDSSDHLLKWKDSSSTIKAALTNPMTTGGDVIYGGASGVATRLGNGSAGQILTSAGSTSAPAWGEGPLTTAGDILVGATSAAPTRLAIGGVGGALSVINSAVAWNSGTSFPGSKSSGDRYWRSDGSLEYFWNGTSWLSSSIIVIPFGPCESAFPLTADGLVGRAAVWGATDLYLVEMLTSTYVATTNDGSHYWTITCNKNNAAGTPTSVASFNTSADTVNNYTARSTSINALLGSFKSFQVNAVRTSTPGSLYFSGFLHVRVVGT